MKTVYVLLSLLFMPIVTCAQSGHATVRLQCKGTYDNYQVSDMRGVPVQGIYVEISGETVQISGSPGFDATYVVTAKTKSGVNFQLASNPTVGGSINRFSGELGLMAMGEQAADGSGKVKQMVSATCHKAEPMF